VAISEFSPFEASRLTIARLRRRWTKAKLAKEVGVSLRMVSLYEAGDKSPSPETLDRLAAKLEFPVEFFQREALDLPSPDVTSFRSQVRRTGRERDAALAAGALAFDFVMWIEKEFKGIPASNLPDMRSIEPETAAALLRQQWNLGQRRIPNAIHLVELHGVRVFSISEPGTAIDAFSLWRGDMPFIFLNTQKSAERSRHDVMHELGHLLLHRHGAPHGHIAEREADAFASAMLMPRESIQNEAIKYPTLDSLLSKKRKWRVSLASYVYRLHRVGMLTDWHYHLLFMQMSERGYTKSEPDSIPRESSLVLEKVFSQMRRTGKSRTHLAKELGIPLPELNALIFGLVMSAVRGDGGSTPIATVEGAPKLSLAL
jgi:Zn-dependent peptidase ImmA (M78 family)/transcriptional regulator with XRE-family HTH domain